MKPNMTLVFDIFDRREKSSALVLPHGEWWSNIFSVYIAHFGKDLIELHEQCVSYTDRRPSNMKVYGTILWSNAMSEIFDKKKLILRNMQYKSSH